MEKKNQWFKPFTGLLFLLIIASCTKLSAHEKETNWIEKKKTLTFSYTLKPTDDISIDNQFGDVKCKFWDNESVRVEVTITANAPSEIKAEEFLKLVSINSNMNNGLVHFKTNINKGNSPYNNNINHGKNADDKNELTVNYLVFLPEEHNLTIKNSFGDIYLPEFEAVLNVRQNYGTLYADHIRNDESEIDISFGKAYIKSMTGGDLKAQYSSLLLDEALRTRIENNFGKLNILRFIDTEGVISYSSGFIENLKEAVKLKIDFSNGLKFGKMDENLREITIEANYSSVDLPTENANEYTFDVTVNHANLRLPENKLVKFTKNSETEKSDKKAYYSPTKIYRGSIGTSDDKTKITIHSNYGAVKIR